MSSPTDTIQERFERAMRHGLVKDQLAFFGNGVALESNGLPVTGVLRLALSSDEMKQIQKRYEHVFTMDELYAAFLFAIEVIHPTVNTRLKPEVG